MVCSQTIKKKSCSLVAKILVLVLPIILIPCGESWGFTNSRVTLYAEGELLVKFKPHVSSSERQSIHKASSAMVKKRFSFIGVDYIKLPGGLSVKEALRQYMANPDIEYAEPNYLVRSAAVPNDRYFGMQWALRNTGQTITVGSEQFTGKTGADIDATDAWNVSTGSDSVIVAVIDSGVDYNHYDLKDRVLLPNGDAVNFVADNVDDNGVSVYGPTGYCHNSPNKDQNDPMDDDLKSHGTHVAGIIGAIGNNRRGVSGVSDINPNIKILPVKILDCLGTGQIKDVVAGIEYSITTGAKVINASYTYPSTCEATDLSEPFDSSDIQPLSERDAIKAAEEAGILFVAAAGNESFNNDLCPQYPASHGVPYTGKDGKYYPGLSNVISVAASDQDDNMSAFSNYGKTSVHVAAPGMNILSTIRSGIRGQSSHILGYDYDKGTSMAAPFVAGLAALVWSTYPSYTHQDVKDAILNSVEPRPAFAGKTVSGGRINAFSALTGIPARPTGLSARLISGTGTGLSWDDNSNLEEGFSIERKTGRASSFDVIATVAADTTLYDDVTVTKGATYHYRITAYNSNGGSPCSNEVSVKVPSRSLSVSVSGKGSVMSAPAGFDCKGICSKTYISGISVILTAAPDDGQKFVR